MYTWRQFVSRNSLAIFFILAYATSWSFVIPLKGGLVPYGPMLAAVIMLMVTTGRGGLSDLWRQMVHVHVAWVWFLIAPGIVFAFHLGAFLLNLLLGATVTGISTLQPWSAVLLLIVQLSVLGGMWEEPGWSGYALPRLQARFAGHPSGLLVASLILGALRAGWHLPLVMYGSIPWYDFLFYIFALQFLITWLYNRTSQSLPIVMLFHLASNVVFRLMFPLYAGADQARYYWLFIALAWLIVLVTMRVFGPGRKWQANETRATIENANLLGQSE